ncbi:MAG TPA: ribonucleotide-diphosphate reductase subunit beta, partial [Actinomycetota bacterium]|nr:ribonucleotide-diphosphate reductase subunit beta [Actinomycetota bacterium]
MSITERVDSASLTDLRDFHPDEMVTDLEQLTANPVSLRDLYYRWERQNWSAGALDFAQDAADWTALDAEVKERLLWVLTMFFCGEEAVTDDLAPWVWSAPTEEIRHFLATQLADEARHTVFFDRFYREAVGAPGDLHEMLERYRGTLNAGYHELFYEMLPAISREVGANPGDPVVFARGVAMYHMVLEGALAVPGQRYILAFCRERGILPGFRAGFTAVARDESRHVGGGVRILQRLVEMDGDCVPAVQELVRQALPHSTHVFQPPNADFTYLSVLGYDTRELLRFGLHSLNKRLRAAGIPMPSMPPMRIPRQDATPTIPARELTPVQQMLQPMRDQLVPSAVFAALPMVFNPTVAGDLRATFRFDVTGDGG